MDLEAGADVRHQHDPARPEAAWPTRNGNLERADHDWLAYDTRDKDLLDITDAVLSLMPSTKDIYERMIDPGQEAQTRKRALQELLDDARSVYAIKADESAMERRASVMASAAMKEEGHRVGISQAGCWVGSEAPADRVGRRACP